MADKHDAQEGVIEETPRPEPIEQSDEESEKDAPKAEVQSVDVAQPKKSGWAARLRGLVDHVRNKMDDMFTNDDVI